MSIHAPARRGVAAVVAALIAVALAGCATSPTAEGVANGVVYSGNTLLTDVASAVETTDVRGVEEFVTRNGIALSAPKPEEPVGLPWVLAQAATDQELEDRFRDRQPDGAREPTVLALESDGDVGVVRVLLRNGKKESVGFGRSYYVYFACVDYAIDLGKREVAATRAECPALPETLTDLAEALPDSVVAVGAPWP